MFEIELIKKELKEIYDKIPNFECKHCHKCCGPIIWFKVEELLIKDYMKKNKIEDVKWTADDFKKNDMKCPFLKNDRCIIYEVRPIVCRLQGNIPELQCRFNKNAYMSEELVKNIKKDFIKLNKKLQGDNMFYSTRKIAKI
ncbi:MAG: YkgJ family cysteine cluster protein [Thermoplasmatota archaeon]|jgi:Fe-S-cluster containining protein